MALHQRETSRPPEDAPSKKTLTKNATSLSIDIPGSTNTAIHPRPELWFVFDSSDWHIRLSVTNVTAGEATSVEKSAFLSNQTLEPSPASSGLKWVP